MSITRTWLSNYAIQDIYNVDETVLFYKFLPKLNFVVEAENDEELRGIRKMTSKDRVSAYICSNADGTRRVPVSIIGASKNPRAFRKKNPPCKYFSSAKAWSNTIYSSAGYFKFLFRV